MAMINCPECGKEVSSVAESCPNCGYGVKKHFNDIENNEKLKKLEAIQLEKKKKISKILKIVIPIVAVVICMTVGLIVNHSILSKRTTFKNEDEMIKYLATYNNWKLDRKYRNEWLVFDMSGLAEKVSDDYASGCMIKLSPKRGVFYLGDNKYIITNTGDIFYYNDFIEEDFYYKSSYIPPTVEVGSDVLKIELLSSSLDENGTLKSEIQVTNTGKHTYQFVDINAYICNDSEKLSVGEFNIVKTDTDNENNQYVLAPGQSGICSIIDFELPSNYPNLTLSIKDYTTKLNK